jgi:hypothetical protein
MTALLASALLLTLISRLGGGAACEGGSGGSPPPEPPGRRIPLRWLAAAGGRLLPGPMEGSAASVHALEVLRGGWMGQPNPGRGSDWDEPHQGPGHHRRSYGHPREPGAQDWRPAGRPYQAGRMRLPASSSGATSRGPSRHSRLIIRDNPVSSRHSCIARAQRDDGKNRSWQAVKSCLMRCSSSSPLLASRLSSFFYPRSSLPWQHRSSGDRGRNGILFAIAID